MTDPGPRYSEWHDSCSAKQDYLVALLLSSLAGKTIDRICQVQCVRCDKAEITPEDGPFEIYTQEGSLVAFLCTHCVVAATSMPFPIKPLWNDKDLYSYMNNSGQPDHFHINIRSVISAQSPLSNLVGTPISSIELITHTALAADECPEPHPSVYGVVLTAKEQKFGFYNPAIDDLYFSWGDFTESLLNTLNESFTGLSGVHKIFPVS